jgi:hypothetical protein
MTKSQGTIMPVGPLTRLRPPPAVARLGRGFFAEAKRQRLDLRLSV